MTNGSSHIVIVAGGEEDDELFLRDVLGQGDFWCADRGYLLCHPLGLMPRLLIGDLDSVSAEHIEAVRASGGEILRFPPEKNESDLELAVREAQGRGFTSITFVGLAGGRLDHALFNLLAILGLAQDMGIDCRARSSQSEVRLLLPGIHLLSLTEGALCSLLPLSDTVEDVVLEGLYYPLRGETLHRTSTRGLSNVVTQSQVTISLGAGRLLLILPCSGRGVVRQQI